jgi:hypothetical protein
MFGPLRMLYEMPSRRKKERPKTLPLKVKHSPEQKEWSVIQVPHDEVPLLISMPHFSMPELLTGNRGAIGSRGPTTKRLWLRGASPSHIFDAHMENLVAKLGVHSIMPEGAARVPEFCSMLAKIAHSFAVAEAGLDAFEPLLLPILLGEDLSEWALVIGSNETADPPGRRLHELSIGFSEHGNLVVVRIRLLACLGTPTYYVVVGRADRIRVRGILLGKV